MVDEESWQLYEKRILTRKRIWFIIGIAWVLSLISTLGIVLVALNTLPTGGPGDTAIITTQLADGSVTSAKILDGTIVAVDLADGSIVSVKIADAAVTSTKIADGAVEASKIAADAIITSKLADGSVTSAKVLDGSLTGADLADGSILTIKIADGAVTTNKIADGAVTSTKLAGGAIPHFVTSNLTAASTSSTSFSTIPGLSVSFVLDRTSTLIISTSVQASLSGGTLYWRATVDGAAANPDSTTIILTGVTAPHSYSYAFYSTNAGPGPHIASIEWRVSSGANTGTVEERILTVIGLPD